MTPMDKVAEFFQTLPRKVLFRYFALYRATQHRASQSVEELKGLMQCLGEDLKTERFVVSWNKQLADGCPSEEAQLWFSLKLVCEEGYQIDWEHILAAENILWSISKELSIDLRFKDTNPRYRLSQEAAVFCIEKLVAHTTLIDTAERSQFRRSEREAYCKKAAEDEGRTDLLPFMTTNLFAERVIPEVNRRLLSTGVYVRPRRPRKAFS